MSNKKKVKESKKENNITDEETENIEEQSVNTDDPSFKRNAFDKDDIDHDSHSILEKNSNVKANFFQNEVSESRMLVEESAQWLRSLNFVDQYFKKKIQVLPASFPEIDKEQNGNIVFEGNNIDNSNSVDEFHLENDIT